ncbi:MAG: SMI1/KNR4 family protein [Planctomycetota bacterium]
MNAPDYPPDFLTFLESHTGNDAYEFDDVDWWVATKSELVADINIDGTEYMYSKQLAGYSNALAALSGGMSTEDDDGNAYPLARLAAGLAFATGDGEVLYFDPADGFSVWQFEHDGGEVTRLADSFTDWLQSADLETD